MENMFNKQKMLSTMLSNASRDGSLESIQKMSLQYEDDANQRATSLEDDQVRFTFQKQSELADGQQKVRDDQLLQKGVQVKKLDLKSVRS